MNSKKLEVSTYVLLAVFALVAFSARNVSFACHVISGLKAFHSRAYLHNLCTAFMAQYSRQLYVVVLCPCVPYIYVLVSSAYSCCLHLYKDLSLIEDRLFHILKNCTDAFIFFYYCSHCNLLFYCCYYCILNNLKPVSSSNCLTNSASSSS